MGQLARSRVRESAGSLAPTSDPTTSLAPFLVAVFVLAGLFGMHGLAGHGMASLMSHTTQMSPSMDASMPDRFGQVMSAVPATAHGAAAQRHSAPTHPEVAGAPASVPGAMAGLCLAVLGGLALLLLCLALARRRTGFRVDRSPHRTPGKRPGRGREPPCLFELSVCRC